MTATAPRPATQGTVRRGDLAAVWTSAEAKVVAEVDLDAEHPAPPHRRRPLVGAAVVVAVVGLLGASALRSALTQPPAPTAPAVTAWTSLRSADPDLSGAVPSVVVLVTVANRGATDRLVTAVSVTGPSTAGPAQDATAPPGVDATPDRAPDRALPGTRPSALPLTVPAGAVAVTAVRIPVRCNGSGDAGLTLDVRIADAPDAIAAVPVGPLADAGGACAAVAAARPQGADAPATVRSARFTATSARLVVDLPGPAQVTAVDADGLTIPLAGQSGTTRRTLVLGAPAAGCTPGTRGVVPTGVQVHLDDGGVRYALVGPDLARWLLTTRCPSAEGGEVRPLGASS